MSEVLDLQAMDITVERADGDRESPYHCEEAESGLSLLLC